MLTCTGKMRYIKDAMEISMGEFSNSLNTGTESGAELDRIFFVYSHNHILKNTARASSGFVPPSTCARVAKLDVRAVFVFSKTNPAFNFFTGENHA